MKILILISTVLVLTIIAARGESYPNCDVSRTVRIAFSSADKTDILSVAIKGRPCHEASLEISITSRDGRQLYNYEAPFKRHVPSQWDDPNLAAGAEKLTDLMTNDSSFKRTSDLPRWLPENEYYEANYQTLQVGRMYYDELRGNDWPVYTHLSHYEGWKVIAFDQRRKQTVVVSEGGL